MFLFYFSMIYNAVFYNPPPMKPYQLNSSCYVRFYLFCSKMTSAAFSPTMYVDTAVKVPGILG